MKSFAKVILGKDSNIRDVLEIIDSGDMRIALIVEANNKLIGTVSDGDIRRAFLKGATLDDPIEGIIFKDFTYAKAGDSKDKLIKLAKYNQIYIIPIIDENFILLGIEEVNDLIDTKEYANKVVLMVGGLGTRLRPLTDDMPKPLLKVGNKPILETIIDNFSKYGFKDFILSVNYKSEMIKKHFGNGSRFGVNIEYVQEDKRMGTAGALSLMREKLKDDFFVMNGDLLTNVNYEHLLNYHLNDNAVATMCVKEYDFQIPYGVVNIEHNHITSISEKPIHKFFVNAGIYMLSPSTLEFIPNNEFFDMPTLFDNLIQHKQKSISFPIREYWLDIGEIEEYKKANIEYLDIFEGKDE
ncbi:nucleotidyl transferase [Sulfurimonas gotlandica GD1]|uniref:Nucleotidyl transferase n=1 Tax=Sulfurimonas gotlandica (strain DSM 19862 / JCM 16533 / GD1) TaxID=929558 RepID=B6BGD8_SULGG|nr:nucleotidyltransferase family protein [Sulfurimonas gotlandica]EDZ63213.1 nucleotidyl transferase [Sulfurimonas gotlandica GD1]EHP29565.1 nucleotidyl transferase [Sulfurimonas gotlandica GD1]